MTYGAHTLYDLTAYDHRPESRKAHSQNVFGNAALACVVLACAWIVYANVAATGVESAAAVEPTAPTVETAATVQTAPAVQTVPTVQTAPTEPDAPLFDVALLDATYSLGLPPGTFSKSEPRQAVAAFTRVEIPIAQDVPPPQPPAARQLAQSVPLPPPRPSELALPPSRNPSLHAMAQRNKAPSTVVAEEPTIFEKLFGKPQAFKPELAYAAPDGGILGDGQSISSGRSPPYDRLTAVYDISAHTVYMPDGTQLEAHSGLGSRLDDPRHVAEKMRGPTPPHVYELEPREQLFHGVQALRLNPVGGEGNVFGRTGLLAHTYMLGPNGDSNGCVSFRNYNAFLRAYMNHKVKRLVVVARLP